MSDSIIGNMMPRASGNNDYSKEEMLRFIEARVIELLYKDPKLLFSYLYRLDISEAKVNTIMRRAESNAAHGLAQLILERQLERIKTKKNMPQLPIDGWQ